LNAVVMESQRSKGAKVKLTLETEADAEDRFSEADIGVVRDNARQLKFATESPGSNDRSTGCCHWLCRMLTDRTLL
jgi:hypothetical protein